MTILLCASTGGAYLFSGLVCYLLSSNKSKPYPRSTSPSLFKTPARLWVAALWPVWMIGEIVAEDDSAVL